MIETVTIVEINGRSEQGVIRPFRCRGEDKKWYWVKGSMAGKRALCCEWLAGRLAQIIGLPIPEFRQVYVPREIIDFSLIADITELGYGIAFGSEDIGQVQEFVFNDKEKISETLRMQILLFDWWVQNTDRTLGARGGNPNLLWEVKTAKPWIIDHNMAFTTPFSVREFIDSHVFGSDSNLIALQNDLDIKTLMRDTISRVQELFEELPEDWVFLDHDHSLPVDISAEFVVQILNRIDKTLKTN